MTALSTNSMPDPSRLGVTRRLARISDDEGYVRVLAIDHPENYLRLFDPDIRTVSFDEVVQSKLTVLQSLSPHSTAVLLDPVWSFGHAVATGIVPGGLGLISGLELLYPNPDSASLDFATELTLREGWDPACLAALGCDAAKLVVFYRSEDGEVNDRLHADVADIASQCHRLQLPLIVEPLWYPVDGEDPTDPAIQDRRTNSVIESAAQFSSLGADILKVEFPTADAADPRTDDAVAAMAAGINGPWVLLSAGATFEAFRDQMDVAVNHRCSGYIAGRSIWGDAVGRLDDATQAQALEKAAQRLDVLNEIVFARGTPVWNPVSLDEVTTVIPETWPRDQAGLSPDIGVRDIG